MSIFHLLVPFDKCIYESALPNAEIMNRLNWFIATPFRGGSLNGVNMIGNVSGNNFFFEPIPGSYSKGINQFAGTVDGNRISLFIRLKPKSKKSLLIISAIILVTGILVPFIDSTKANPDEIGSFWGGVGVVFLIILITIKVEAAKSKNFIRQMLMAKEV